MMKKVLCALLVILSMLAMLPEGTGGWNAPAMADEPTIMQIATGAHHSFALFSDGSLYAWGVNTSGQLGDGTYINRHTPVLIGTGFTAIAAGYWQSFALKGNTLYAWGSNSDGIFNDVKYSNTTIPVYIGTGFTAIATGAKHTLALKGNTLYTWGSNYEGELGDGTFTNRYTPRQIGTGYTAIAANWSVSFALKGNALYAWGRNSYNQLGDGTLINRNTPTLIGTGFSAISTGSSQSCALKGNTLFRWGCIYAENGMDSTLIKTPTQIGTGYSAVAVGSAHFVALKGDALYTCGDNTFGQLGDGTYTYRETPVQIGTGYSAIASGQVHSLAIKGNDLYTWGDNMEGQLGDGTNTNNNTPTRVIFPHEQNNTFRIPDTGVMITPNKVKVYVGEPLALIAAVSPSNATNKNVSWSSSNTDIATVSSDGVVNGIKDGQVKIIVVTASGNYATCTVTVKEIKASSVKIDRIYVEIAVGESVTLNATVLPTNTYNKNITWTSNKAVASVSSSGIVTGVKAGRAAITAKTVYGKSAKCTVIVMPLPLKVTLDRKTAEIVIGKSLTLKATVTPCNAYVKTITWTSSDERIATVTSKGIVTGKKKGTATITVMTTNGKTAKCVVTVLSK